MSDLHTDIVKVRAESKLRAEAYEKQEGYKNDDIDEVVNPTKEDISVMFNGETRVIEAGTEVHLQKGLICHFLKHTTGLVLKKEKKEEEEKAVIVEKAVKPKKVAPKKKAK